MISIYKNHVTSHTKTLCYRSYIRYQNIKILLPIYRSYRSYKSYVIHLQKLYYTSCNRSYVIHLQKLYKISDIML